MNSLMSPELTLKMFKNANSVMCIFLIYEVHCDTVI